MSNGAANETSKAPVGSSSAWLTPEFHKKLIYCTLSLYMVATMTSIAGMEIFGWLTFLLNLLYIIRLPRAEVIRPSGLSKFVPWKTGLALIAIIAIGLWVNGTSTADYRYDMGSLRWIFLFWNLSFAFALWPPTLRWYRLFLMVIGTVALYAYFQTGTGIDLLRPGSHRAVQSLDFKMNGMLWRSAGLFASPLQYAYIAGQHVCLPLALALLLAPHREKHPRLFWSSVAVYALVSVSVITTFTRGAWVAMAISQLTIAALVSTRMAAGIAGAGAVALTVMFVTIETFRVRLLTLFNPAYTSNDERVFLWRANFEMFKDYPIFGIGYLENETRAGEYVARLGKPKAFTGHAHNNYIQMLSGTGITGFVAYLFLIGFMLWLTVRLWRRLPTDLLWPRALCLAALGAQIHIHIGGFTECNFKAVATNHNLMVFWALVVAMSFLESKGLLPKSRFAELKV